MELRYFLLVVLGTIQFARGQEGEAIRFESTTGPYFTVKSRFTGTAVVTSNAIEVRIESAVVSFPAPGKQGDTSPRPVESYFVSLATGAGRLISHSQHVKVQKELMFGKELTLPATNLTIPLENIGSRTNHGLQFAISHHSERFPQNGYSFSQTRTDLFTNLPLTTFREPLASETRPASSATGFIQKHWTNFPAVNFLRPTNGNETVFQHFKVKAHVVGQFNGKHYSGIRFTVPAWMDGDFEFAYVHLYRSAQELRQRPGFSWGITAEHGQFYGLPDVERVILKDLPETQARFPFTEKAYTGAAKLRHFVPGQSYVLWQSHYWNRNDGVVPDFAVAMTVISERGRKEFGEITWR